MLVSEVVFLTSTKRSRSEERQATSLDAKPTIKLGKYCFVIINGSGGGQVRCLERQREDATYIECIVGVPRSQRLKVEK